MLHPSKTALRAAFALILALVVAACSSGSQSSPGAGAQVAGGPTISFAGLTDGAQVSVPFNVTVDSSVPLGPPESGNNHAHLYFDSVTTNQADYDILYSTQWQVTRQLSPGQHTL